MQLRIRTDVCLRTVGSLAVPSVDASPIVAHGVRSSIQQGPAMPITVRPLSYALGAEIQGVDLAKSLSNSEFDQIHRAFLEKGILLFRDQKITREQHIAFSRRFGELDDHASLPRDRHPDYPELLLVTNIPEKDGKPSASKY